jgi:hypothetical protein
MQKGLQERSVSSSLVDVISRGECREDYILKERVFTPLVAAFFRRTRGSFRVTRAEMPEVAAKRGCDEPRTASSHGCPRTALKVSRDSPWVSPSLARSQPAKNGEIVI